MNNTQLRYPRKYRKHVILLPKLFLLSGLSPQARGTFLLYYHHKTRIWLIPVDTRNFSTIAGISLPDDGPSPQVTGNAVTTDENDSVFSGLSP